MTPDYEKIAEGLESPEIEQPNMAEEVLPEVEAVRKFYPVDHPKYQGIGAAKGYVKPGGEDGYRIIRTSYSHEAMIDVILANPNIKQYELAERFDRSVPWISRIIGSDAFQAALAKRREEITDPFLIATIEERFRGLAFQSLDIIAEKLQKSQSVDLALKGLDIAAKSLGFGARGGLNNNVQNNFVVALPGKIANAADWVAESLKSANPRAES